MALHLGKEASSTVMADRGILESTSRCSATCVPGSGQPVPSSLEWGDGSPSFLCGAGAGHGAADLPGNLSRASLKEVIAGEVVRCAVAGGSRATAVGQTGLRSFDFTGVKSEWLQTIFSRLLSFGWTRFIATVPYEQCSMVESTVCNCSTFHNSLFTSDFTP
jgi:hypothetical protein